MTKEIPISKAKEIAREFNYEQVVIMGFNSIDKPNYHVTTYGISKEKCKDAALAGDFVKKAIGGKWS